MPSGFPSTDSEQSVSPSPDAVCAAQSDIIPEKSANPDLVAPEISPIDPKEALSHNVESTLSQQVIAASDITSKVNPNRQAGVPQAQPATDYQPGAREVDLIYQRYRFEDYPRLSPDPFVSPPDPSYWVAAASLGVDIKVVKQRPWYRRLPWVEIACFCLGVGGMVGIFTWLYFYSSAFSLGISLIAACFPMILVSVIMIWMDRWNRAPALLLLVSFLWGAGISTALALFANTFGQGVIESIYLGPARLQSNGLTASVVAPLVEETLKGSGIVLVVLLRRKYISTPLDAVVIAGLIATGFAFTENVLYFTNATYGEFALVFVARAILSPCAHAVFTTMFGLALGLACCRFKGRNKQVLVAVIGYLTAVCLHASWNGLSSYDGILFLTAYLIMWIPLFSVWLASCLVVSARQKYSITRGLSAYLKSGWIDQQEFQMLSGLGARREAYRQAKKVSKAAAAQMRSFQWIMNQLALNYITLRTAGLTAHLEAENQQLLSELQSVRKKFSAAS